MDPAVLPDFTALFFRPAVKRLHFRARNGACFSHDIQYLSGYLHDARLSTGAVTLKGKRLAIDFHRDCWEIPNKTGSGELYNARSRLVCSPVAAVEWEIGDLPGMPVELWVESIYPGEACWETPDAGELLISAPHQQWRIRIVFESDDRVIRLDDQELPYLWSVRHALPEGGTAGA